MSKNQEIRTIATSELRIATSPDGVKTLVGKIPYNSLSVDLGGFQERIAPGAFASALKAGADVLCLRDHDAKLLLGRTKSKTMKLTDTSDALTYTCDLPNTTQASDLEESVNRGDLDATSFGFITLDDEWSTDPSGFPIRTLIAVELLECSPCSFAAYPDSAISMRSCPASIRSIIEKRDDPDADVDPDCDCDCPQCQAGDCADCSNAECDSTSCMEQHSDSMDEDNENANLRTKIRLAFAESI